MILIDPSLHRNTEAPQEVKDKVVAKGEDDSSSEEHRLRLARLEFEHLQRRQMHESLQKLNAEKRAYQRTILEKKSGLAGLKPQLAAILERTKSVQVLHTVTWSFLVALLF